MIESESNENISIALLKLSNTIAEDRHELKKGYAKLTEAVEKLTLSHVETKKDRENDALRMERLEDNQKEQGHEIKTLSDTVILLDERMKTSKDRWNAVDKRNAAIVTAIIVSAILMYLGLK